MLLLDLAALVAACPALKLYAGTVVWRSTGEEACMEGGPVAFRLFGPGGATADPGAYLADVSTTEEAIAEIRAYVARQELDEEMLGAVEEAISSHAVRHGLAHADAAVEHLARNHPDPPALVRHIRAYLGWPS